MLDKQLELGQFFTPDSIVETMLSLRKNKRRVLEPSAGNGAFLSKLEKDAVGIEIDKTLSKDPRLLKCDFFSYSSDNKFETIIGNPPYVRFQDISEKTKNLLPTKMFDKRSNLYLFFIVKCVEHLTPRGELIFITPRDFLKATSARKMNEYLYEFGSMTHYFELGDSQLFENATPNCAIWRWVKGRKTKKMITGGKFFCKNGQIWFGENANNTQLSEFFDIKVGAVSGADDIFNNEKYGKTEMVCSETAQTKKTRKMIYNEEHPCLKKHKTRLLNRKIRIFNESNWWEWGRRFFEKEGERIYVNGKTRNPNPFFISDVEAYDGSVLALFPKKGVDIVKSTNVLNNTDWEKLGFVCDGRLMFTQRSLATAPVGV